MIIQPVNILHMCTHDVYYGHLGTNHECPDYQGVQISVLLTRTLENKVTCMIHTLSYGA